MSEGWLLITTPCGFVHWKVTPGIGVALSERICPAHTGLLLAITGCGGKLPIARLALAVALPHALVIVSESVGLPGLLKQMDPGDAAAEFAGVPPGKVHA